MTTSSSYVNDACEYFSKHFEKDKALFMYKVHRTWKSLDS